ncbi:hypothetical protein ACFL21_01080 [Patescibacteria group bacterium]
MNAKIFDLRLGHKIQSIQNLQDIEINGEELQNDTEAQEKQKGFSSIQKIRAEIKSKAIVCINKIFTQTEELINNLVLDFVKPELLEEFKQNLLQALEAAKNKFQAHIESQCEKNKIHSQVFIDDTRSLDFLNLINSIQKIIKTLANHQRDLGLNLSSLNSTTATSKALIQELKAKLENFELEGRVIKQEETKKAIEKKEEVLEKRKTRLKKSKSAIANIKDKSEKLIQEEANIESLEAIRALAEKTLKDLKIPNLSHKDIQAMVRSQNLTPLLELAFNVKKAKPKIKNAQRAPKKTRTTSRPPVPKTPPEPVAPEVPKLKERFKKSRILNVTQVALILALVAFVYYMQNRDTDHTKPVESKKPDSELTHLDTVETKKQKIEANANGWTPQPLNSITQTLSFDTSFDIETLTKITPEEEKYLIAWAKDLSEQDILYSLEIDPTNKLQYFEKLKLNITSHINDELSKDIKAGKYLDYYEIYPFGTPGIEKQIIVTFEEYRYQTTLNSYSQNTVYFEYTVFACLKINFSAMPSLNFEVKIKVSGLLEYPLKERLKLIGSEGVFIESDPIKSIDDLDSNKVVHPYNFKSIGAALGTDFPQELYSSNNGWFPEAKYLEVSLLDIQVVEPKLSTKLGPKLIAYLENTKEYFPIADPGETYNFEQLNLEEIRNIKVRILGHFSESIYNYIIKGNPLKEGYEIEFTEPFLNSHKFYINNTDVIDEITGVAYDPDTDEFRIDILRSTTANLTFPDFPVLDNSIKFEIGIQLYFDSSTLLNTPIFDCTLEEEKENCFSIGN